MEGASGRTRMDGGADRWRMGAWVEGWKDGQLVGARRRGAGGHTEEWGHFCTLLPGKSAATSGATKVWPWGHREMDLWDGN